MRTVILIFLLASAAVFPQQRQQFTVYFESGSAQIPEPSRSELASFFSDESLDVESLSVAGYCDDIGSAASNVSLSQARAQAVILFLKQYTSEKIASQANGEIALIRNAGQDEAQRAKNRRADILVSYTLLPQEKETAPEKETADHGYKTFDDELQVGDKVIVKQLLFDGSRTSFFNPEEAEAELMKIVDYFAKNPNVHFEIQGHVCCISAAFRDARNIETGINNLSKARAQKIYEFFLSKGVAKERMTHQGYGRQFPRKDVNESLNKRVEIVITKI